MEEHILQFFAYAHLPAHLQAISKPFCDLARAIVNGESEDGAVRIQAGAEPLPFNPERTKALDHLLAAKDAAVRAKLAK